ncbi:MAG: DUF5106 domain-containing protein [Tannerella sp.]|jgi:peroxiredoxin|nr:DUF5106 domain-containing protein [Tannerella sp.]
MKVDLRIIADLSLVALAVACTPQGKKTDEKAKEESVSVADFKRVEPPTFIVEPQGRADYLVIHFWDNFDFSDTMYCHAPNITEQAFVNFIALFQHASREKVSEGVDKLMTNAEADVVMYNYFFRQAEHYLYEPNSPMRNDEYYIPFLEHVVNAPIVKDVYKIRPKHLLEIAYRNRLGTKALNFTYTMASGQTGNLYGIKAPYTVILFFNPGCTECQRTIEMLKNSPALAAAVTSGKAKILAVYPDKDLAKWREHLDEVPPTWINGYDKSLDIKEKEIYDLKAIPTLYLLDKDKTVILKDTSTGEIQEFFDKSK